MIGRRSGGHLDDRSIARFVDEGERSDAIAPEQVRHLARCPDCQRLVRGHRRARSLLLRHDPGAELPAIVPAGSPRLVPAFATLGVVVLALTVAVGSMTRWSFIASTVEPTPSNVCVLAGSPEATCPPEPTSTPAVTPTAPEPSPSAPEATPTPTPTAPEPTSTPVATPTAPAVTPSPSPEPTPSPAAIRYCISTDVSVAIMREGTGTPPIYWNGAAGHKIATFVLTNVSSTPCRVLTFSTPELLNGDGTVLMEGGTVAGGGAKTVAPGGKLTSLVDTVDLCAAPAIVAPVTVGFRMMDGKNVVAPPVSPTDTEAIPPCNGDPAVPSGMISIKGWTPVP